ncbi:hypothetical protein BAUCODRAFT_441374 [Baudoinia panamericana UAMH 10762]|uniref:Myb-like domain-containing protein n=1 Tax=Baudoinia panamericana (strain UAMH 10762) TaxID=717646 RepID=M2MZU6_BAUPA|nr:uncharacterized protein BAUCODRAFT_441374 [Baudoinia panamericana UAMH 10762]EMC97158.1 hypothetical protein BAUCODRAFT_441374 [Baudoinia panamericana UAMH 10762]
MSQLISSAVPGKQVAPKAPARRRPAAPPKPTAAQATVPAETEAPAASTVSTSTAPVPSEPVANERNIADRVNGAVDLGPDVQPPPAEPSLSRVKATQEPLEAPATGATVGGLPELLVTAQESDGLSGLPVTVPSSDGTLERFVDAQSVGVSDPLIAAPSNTITTEITKPHSRKRKHESVQSDANATTSEPAPSKRPKRSLARSNALVQAEVNEDATPAEAPQPSADGPTRPEVLSAANAPSVTAARPRYTRRKPAQAKAASDQTEDPLLNPQEESSSGVAPDLVKQTRRSRVAASRQVKQTKPASQPKGRGKRKLSEALVSEADRETPELPRSATDESNATPNPAVSTAKPLKRRRKPATQPSEDQHKDARMGAEAVQPPEEPKAKRKRKRKGPDPELHQIDPNTLSMFDLSRDAHHGKASEREKEMEKIDWAEVGRKRREEIERAAELRQKQQREKQKEKDRGAAQSNTDAVPSTEDRPAGANGGDEGEAQPPNEDNGNVEDIPPSQGPTLRIVNGQIVADEASLTLPNAAPADATADPNLLIEEDNDLTRRVNRLTNINNRRRDPAERVPVHRKANDRWTDFETDRFLDLLWAFGTDFGTIARYFAPRSRQQVKTKFNREERLDPVRVNNMLLHVEGTKPVWLPTSGTISLEQYAADTNQDIAFYTKYESAQHAEDVIRESMKGRREDIEAALAEEERERENRKAAKALEEQAKRGRNRAREDKRKENAGKKVGGRGGKAVGAGTMSGEAAVAEAAA